MSGSNIPTIADFADAEHCVLEDVTVRNPAIDPDWQPETHSEPREVVDEFEVRDRLRGRVTSIRIFAEGWLAIEVAHRRKATSCHRIDLRFLDAAPESQRYYPVRLMRASAIAAGLTAIFALPALFGWLTAYAVPAAVTTGLIAAASGVISFYRSHEKICFRTLHGRAQTIQFSAGLGTIRKFRKLVPQIVEAIGKAAESVTDQTAVYLRAEMREHYRLRGEGLLTDQQCSDSTGRILANFEGVDKG